MNQKLELLCWFQTGARLSKIEMNSVIPEYRHYIIELKHDGYVFGEEWTGNGRSHFKRWWLKNPDQQRQEKELAAANQESERPRFYSKNHKQIVKDWKKIGVRLKRIKTKTESQDVPLF